VGGSFSEAFRKAHQWAVAHPDRAGVLLVLGLSIAYLSVYWLSFEGHAFQVGNDFDTLYYRYKAYLLDVMSRQWRIPLWSPSEGGGYPFYGSPFAAAFYPLNLALAVFYALAGGYSMHDHQVFAACGAWILCLGLYAWLRSLRVPVWPAVFAAVALGTSMKVTEAMRFPNAVHTAAWMPWVLLGVNLAVRRQRAWRGLVLIAAGMVMMITAGYPYYVYYFQFLLGPYVALMLFDRTRSIFFFVPEASDTFVGFGRALARVTFALSVAGAICLPYLWKVQTMLSQTQDRGGGDFQYSTQHEWGWCDTLGSLCYPPAAMSEGWYYFGSLALLVILVYAASCLRPAEHRGREAAFLGIALAWWLLLTWITMGARSQLFVVLWHDWPGFAHLRTWPRMNILLVVLLAWLLARACARLQLFAPSSESRREAAYRLACLLGAYALVGAAQWGFFAADYTSDYYTQFFTAGVREYLPPAWFPLHGVVAVLALGVFVWRRGFRGVRSPAALGAWATGLLVLNMIDVGPLGLTQWGGVSGPEVLARRPLNVAQQMTRSLSTPRVCRYGTLTLSPEFNAGVVENWYYGRYVSFLDRSQLGPFLRGRDTTLTRDRAAALVLLGARDGRRLYCVRRIDHATPEALLQDDTGAGTMVLRYTGDLLEVEVQSDSPGYLCFIDNWDPDWTATVDRQPVPVERVLGTFKAVAIGVGTSRVQFAYRPFW